MRKKNSTKQLLQNHMVLVSSLFPDSTIISTPQMVPGQGVSGNQKTRRMRKRARTANEVHEYKKARLSTEQLYLLEQNFKSDQKLDTKRKYKLASELGMTPRQLAVWFQNRRARMKTQTLEKKYANLKTSFENLKAEKRFSDIEVLDLKKKVCNFEARCKEYETVLQILLGVPIAPIDAESTMSTEPIVPALPSLASLPAFPSVDPFSASSPQSVISMESDQGSPLFKEFGVDAYEDIFCDVPPEYLMHCSCMELWEWDWLNYLNTY